MRLRLKKLDTENVREKRFGYSGVLTLIQEWVLHHLLPLDNHYRFFKPSISYQQFLISPHFTFIHTRVRQKALRQMLSFLHFKTYYLTFSA